MCTVPTEIYTYGHTLSLHDALPIWLTAVVDLPTPPFPEPMAMMLRTRGSGLRLGCTAWAGMRGIADVLGFGEAREKPVDSGCCECVRSEEHTSELQSLMRISYAVFCLKKKHHFYTLNWRRSH